ncbi:MAG: anti-sigma factor [Spirosomataceae bacterium]
MKWIQMLVDGETSPEETQRIQENIGKCLPCEKGFTLENAIKDALKFRIDKKEVPTNLKDLIRQKINIF